MAIYELQRAVDLAEKALKTRLNALAAENGLVGITTFGFSCRPNMPMFFYLEGVEK